MQGGPSAMRIQPAHRGAWCPGLPLPLPTVAEMDTTSTNAGPLSEVAEDGESSEDSPEWTPREMGERVGARPLSESGPRVTILDSESQPPWVTMAPPKAVPRLSLPQMFDVYTPRSPRSATKPKASSTHLDIPTGYTPHRANDLPCGIPCGVLCSPRGTCEVPCSPGMDTARREVAEAHVELLARAAELRRREKRLQQKIEHQGGGADKENVENTNDLDTSFDSARRSDQECSFDSFRKNSRTSRNTPVARIAPEPGDCWTQNRREALLDSGRRGAGISGSSQRFHTIASSNIHRPGDLVHGSGPLPARTRRAKTVSPRELYASRAAFSPRDTCTPREFRTNRESREVRRENREVLHDSPREAREVRSRRSASTATFSEISRGSGGADSDTRRMRKEIRLERRLRRRAEEAATAVWRNALLIAGAVSLCVVGVTALSVAFAIRH